MIFMSDLDRTLIYSEKFIRDNHSGIRAVEYGKYNSYMTERAVELLLKIVNRVIFVPCTTRTIEQYRRIQFFQQECMPKYAVVSNGGNLIVDGVVEQNYIKAIKKSLETDCLPAGDLLQQFNKFSSEKWAEPLREADGLFYYCIVDRLVVPKDELTCFSAWASGQNWEVSLQGRKLYLVPKVINKGAALEKLLELTQERTMVAAGDSLLDLPMLERAEYAFCPAHGELYDSYGQARELSGFSFNFIETAGLYAAEEILEKVLACC